MSVQIYSATVMEDGDCYVMARLYKKDSADDLVIVAIADFSTISRVVKQGGTAVIGPTSLTVANVVRNSLSTGSIWSIDDIGFNFIDLVPATAFPNGGLTYRVEYTFTMGSGTVFTLAADVTTLEIATT